VSFCGYFYVQNASWPDKGSDDDDKEVEDDDDDEYVIRGMKQLLPLSAAWCIT